MRRNGLWFWTGSEGKETGRGEVSMGEINEGDWARRKYMEG